MTRLRDRFDARRAEGKSALVIYITEGDPSPAATADIVRAAADAGADAVELGVPFSDPSADGPVIQAAMQRALGNGGSLKSALATARAVRAAGCEVPLVLFGYYNPIFVYGTGRLAADARDAGIDALLTVDVPLGELGELAAPSARAGLGVVPLVAPTSGDDRVAQAAALDPPFVYYISMTGITGAAFSGSAGGAERVAKVREAVRAPVAVGFGIKTGDDARAVAAYADGVVVGSAVVSRIQAAGAQGAPAAVGEFVADLRRALDAPPRS